MAQSKLLYLLYIAAAFISLIELLRLPRLGASSEESTITNKDVAPVKNMFVERYFVSELAIAYILELGMYV